MVRKLKHHEQKLLRKVDFITYASDNNHRDAVVIRRYAIQKPSDYQKYNRISGVCRRVLLVFYFRVIIHDNFSSRECI
jgi:U3 small nucleolar ribonucleoprotein protein IMP3